MPPGTACCALADNMKARRDLAEPYEELRQLRKKVEQAEKRRNPSAAHHNHQQRASRTFASLRRPKTANPTLLSGRRARSRRARTSLDKAMTSRRENERKPVD